MFKPSPYKDFSKGLILALVAVSFAVYANSLTGGFVYDDIENVLENHWIRDVRYLYDIFTMQSATAGMGHAERYYRPLVQVIFMLGYHLFGLNAWGYHLVNVVLHILASVAVFFVSQEIFGGSRAGGQNSPALAAFAAAVLFAAHPVHTEAVSWISGVMDLSFSFFYLVSFYLYVKAFKGRVPRVGYYALSVTAFFASALCKEPALTLPAVLFAYDRIFGKGTGFRPRGIVRYVPYVILAVAYMVIRWQALGGLYEGKSPASHGGYVDMLNTLTLFSGYLAKLLLPVNLNVDYMFRPAGSILDPKWAASTVVVALFAAGVYAARRDRAVLMGVVFMVLPLSPALYLPALGVSAFADRYLYLPSAGFAMILASIFGAALNGSRRRAIAVAILLLVVTGTYAVACIDRNTVWRDDYSLWTDSVKKSPDNPTAHRGLGFALESKGRLEESVAEYKTALRLDPADVYAHVNMGKVYKEMGREGEAYEHYVEALKIRPGLVEAHYNLGNYYLDRGQYDEAAEQYGEALEAQPNYVKAYTNLGAAYLQQGRTEKAKEYLLVAVNLDAFEPDARNNLGIVYARTGLLDKAAESFGAAVRLDPDNASYRKNLEAATNAAGNK